MEADIKLLIGVARGGKDGNSDALIQKELDDIFNKIKINLDAATIGKQLQDQLNAISKSNNLGITISKIDISNEAITDLKKKLGIATNGSNNQAGGSGNNRKNSNSQSPERAAQLEVLNKQKSSIGSLLSNTHTSELKYKKEADAVEKLTDRYASLSQRIAELRDNRSLSMDDVKQTREALIAEGRTLSKETEAFAANTAAAKAANKEKEKSQSQTSVGRATTATISKALNSLGSVISSTETAGIAKAENKEFNDYLKQYSDLRVKYDEMMRLVQSGTQIKVQDRKEILKTTLALTEQVKAFAANTAAAKAANAAQSERDSNASKFGAYDIELSKRLSSTKSYIKQLSTANIPSNEQTVLQGLVADYAELNAQHDALLNNKTQDVEQSKQYISSLLGEVKVLEERAAALKEIYIGDTSGLGKKRGKANTSPNGEGGMATLQNVISAYKEIGGYMDKNPRISGGNLSQLELLKGQLFDIIIGSKDAKDGLTSLSKQDLKKILSDFSALDLSITEAGEKGNTLTGIIASAYKKFGGWMLVTRSLIMIVNSFKQMVSNVKTLDSAMTELKKVTDEARETYNNFFDKAASRAKSLGVTLADTINATADFARLGYSIEEASGLADAALVYKNVGDGISDISEASESVISTMKAFGIEAADAMTIVDKFNEIGNNFAISSSGIGEALVRSASSLASAGNTLDESIALITAANNVVQNPETVGTTLKTVTMYLRAAKTEADEAGESTEGMASSVSKLRKSIKDLTGDKVDIMVDSDTFKSTYQILKELSAVWEGLTDASQANILELIGGKRNSNVLSSLLSNFEDAEAVLGSAADSAGSALAENEKYLDSIAGKLAQFQSAFEALSAAVVDSDFIKTVVNAGTTTLDQLTTIAEKLGSFPALIGAITTAATAYSNIKSKGNGFGLFGVNVNDGKSSIGLSKGTASVVNWVKYATDIAEYNTGIGKLAGAYVKSNDALSKYLQSLNGAKASMAGFRNYCKQTGISIDVLDASQRRAAISATILNTAVSAIVSIGISYGIQLLITGISNLANAYDNAIEKTEELATTLSNLKKETSDNISSLESVQDEFERLSVGVSEHGENISLTSEEYDRYKEIVQSIVEISPSLSEGYSTENGYLAEKNNLVERAIELQEKQYKNELREMTTTENLGEAIKGYAATYDKFRNSGRKTDLADSISDMLSTDEQTQISQASQIMKALGIEDVKAELNKYKTGYQGDYAMSWSSFWNDYGEQVAQNIDKIAASIDYSEAGFKNASEFESYVTRAEDAATRYLSMLSDIDEANQGVTDWLNTFAQTSAMYDELDAAGQDIVSNFISRFDLDDVTRRNFLGQLVDDEDAINDVKTQIIEFLSRLTPEVQNSVSELSALKVSFDAGDVVSADFQKSAVSILNELKAAGFDDETTKYLKLSIEWDSVQQQIDAIKEALGGTDHDYDELLGKMTHQELKYAYAIVAEEGSMTFDELQSKIEQMKYANANMVNIFDFSEMITNLDEAADGLDNIISAMKELRKGTALTKGQLASLALEYPKLLQQANLFTDGSVSGQKQMLNSILELKESEYEAEIDAKINELKATEEVINAQLEMEKQKANIIGEIENMSVNGKLDQEEELVNKISQLNDLQGQNYVSEKEGELVVNSEALSQMGDQGVSAAEQATENIWEPYGNSIKIAHTQGLSRGLEAIHNYSSKLSSKLKNIASGTLTAFAKSVKDAMSGNWKNIANNFSSISLGDTSVSTGDVVVTFDGGRVSVGNTDLNDWVSSQKAASKQRIEALKDLQQRTINAYTNLEALKGLDLTTIYGSKIGGSDGSSKKSVEEYIADVDAFSEAEQRLQAAQEKAESLSKKIKYSEDVAEKISLSGDLIDAYKEEAEAEKELMALKKSTISSNVASLRALGFEIEYNSDTDELYIKNLEHLNELTASSAGEYDSLQEATNALRKKTEKLIDTTEELNDDNIESAENIEDLGYTILETKNNIIDYIEEVYDKQVESYQKIIDLRKEMIESAKDEYDYESDIADKVKEIAELQAQIDQLALDDSRSAQAERRTLQEELAEKQEELADTQRDHSVDAQTDALDKMSEDYEADKEAELELLKNTVNSSEELWTAFYKTLLGQSVSIGESINEEIASAWIKAANAVKEYSESVRGVSGVGTIVSNIQTFHDGGVVDEANLNKDEALAILQKGEIVLNDGKQQSLYRIIDFQTELSKRLGVAIGSISSIPITSNGIASTLSGLTQEIIGGASQGMVFGPHFEVNIMHNGEMADSDARAYGEQIASVAIDKLYSAFERRGISSTRGSRLKP